MSGRSRHGTRACVQRSFREPRFLIEALSHSPSERDVDDLAQVLVDVVNAGGSVSFMAPLPLEEAKTWWHSAFAKAAPNAVFFVDRDDEGIVGTVQLHPAWQPNQLHRADIAKLMVHSRGRRRGIARALMTAAETHARQMGLTLLTLDTVRGDAAEQLYAGTGWERTGVIPCYALDPFGKMCDTVIFFKHLAS